jgi:hypothetical protein
MSGNKPFYRQSIARVHLTQERHQAAKRRPKHGSIGQIKLYG